MHIKAAELMVESVRRRERQGDCPTEPALSVEKLEDLVVTLADLLAAARRGAGDTERLEERYREACEALARKHNNPECACVFCEDLRAARAAHPEEPQHG